MADKEDLVAQPSLPCQDTAKEAEATTEGSRPQFGGRALGAGEDVFRHNAWDNVEWGEAQRAEAASAVAGNSTVGTGGCRLYSGALKV